MPSVTELTAAATMTRVALRVLDIPFDPALSSGGELFDRVIEHLSHRLSDAGAAELSGTPATANAYLSMPEQSPLDRRRALAALRHEVANGRLPGNTTTFRIAHEAIGAAHAELAGLLQTDPGPTTGRAALTDVVGCLARLERTLGTYRMGRNRLNRSLKDTDSDRQAVADAAARLERDLARELGSVVRPQAPST